MVLQRFSRLLLATLAAAFLMSIGAPAANAQTARRWVADPALLAYVKMIGLTGQQTADSVIDIDLLSPYDGWAVSYASLLRFDGRYWKRQSALTSTTTLRAVDFVTPTEGWVAGMEYERQPPYRATVLLGRVDPRLGTINPAPVLRQDGSTGPIAGNLNDVAALSGAALAVGGTPIAERSWQRPLVLAWNGTQWRDATPPELRYGYLSRISMVSPNEGWATGVLGIPGGEGDDAVRPAILHYREGQWTEERLPALPISGQPFTMGQIVMKDAGEGWAVFQDIGTSCSNAKLLRFSGGVWAPVEHAYASTISLGLIPGTNRGWVSLGGCSARGTATPDRRMRFEDGVLTPDISGATLVPTTYALLSEDLQWAAAGGSMMRYTADRSPADRVAGAGAGARYFPETGHTIAGEFRGYYETHGLELGDRGISARESLALFGYPVTEPFDEINPETGAVLQVQYFERARMELHPENQAPYRVLLGRLGFAGLMVRNGHVVIPNMDTSPPASSCQHFPETGYSLCPPLRDFWRKSGGLAVFGFPITTANDELSVTDGKTYLTQWFERERLEYHPELRGTPYEVLLGLLGSEDLRRRGMLP